MVEVICTLLALMALILFTFLILSVYNSYKSKRCKETVTTITSDTEETKLSSSKYYHVYKTKDGEANFIFRYVYIKHKGIYEIDIIWQPPYNGRESDASVSHRLSSSRSDCRCKICIYDDKAPRTLEAAMQVSADWAELTHKYIKTGVTIDRQISKRW